MGNVYNALYTIDKFIGLQSDKEKDILEWAKECNVNDIRTLLYQRDLIQRYIKSETCIKNINPLLENVRSTTGKFDKFVQTVDDSNLDEWKANNPKCVSFESWEKATIFNNLPDYKAVVDDFKQISEMVYDFKVDYEYKSSQVYDILVEAKECSLNPEFEVDSKLCEDYDYDISVKLIECGFNYEIISKFRQCNIEVRFNIEEGCPELEIEPNVWILTCDLGYDILTKEQLCNLQTNNK